MSTFTYTWYVSTFLAHLAFRPCELLSSLFGRRPVCPYGMICRKRLYKKKKLKSFQILLDKYWENQEVKYDYNEEIKVRTGSHKKKFIHVVDIDEEDADIVVERPASIEDPKVS